MSIYIRAIALPIFAIAALLPSAAWGLSCSFGISAMNFGQVDTLSGAQVNSTATMSVNCTGGLLSSRVLICPNLGGGSGGATASSRQMTGGSTSLNYQLFSDAARTVVWGSYFWPYPARPPALSISLNLLGAGSGSATIYGAVLGGQQSVPPGSYLSAFTAGHVSFRYRGTSSSDCSTGTGQTATPSFNVTATVAANCLVSTQTVDFGTTGVLAANVDATGQISVRCTPGTAYSVGLNNGQTGTSPTARRMTLGTSAITYALYRDSARSQPWGNTIGTNTVAGTGSGTAQDYAVYGRVPPQTTPSPGIYTDTVVVTVTY